MYQRCDEKISRSFLEFIGFIKFFERDEKRKEEKRRKKKVGKKWTDEK